MKLKVTSSNSSSESSLSIYSTLSRSQYPPPMPVRASTLLNFGCLQTLHSVLLDQLTLPHL